MEKYLNQDFQDLRTPRIGEWFKNSENPTINLILIQTKKYLNQDL